jgi:hypothetical protein
LLLLRVLALILLVGAFAWPYDPTLDAIVVKESRVYVLDNTLSHQANGALAKARENIASDLEACGREIQTAVIELTSQPRVASAFGDDRKQAAEKVRALKPTYQRGSFLAAFRQANTLLANSLGERRQILFFTDNQENEWAENTESPPFLHGVKVDLKGADPLLPKDNLSVAEPQVQRIFLGDKSLATFTVHLSHHGAAKTARVILRSNGQVIFDRSVDLEKKPEDVLLQAQWEADPTLWLRGEVTVEGTPDALAADDRVFFSLPPVKEGQVALLAQSRYLQLALSPDVMRGQWATRVLDPTRLKDEVAAGRDAEVLVIESHYLQSAEARTLVSRYLSNGRGVILLVDRVTPLVSGFLRELGFEPGKAHSSEPGGAEKIQYVSSQHPIFHPFLSPDYGNLTEIRVQRYTSLIARQGMPLLVSGKGEPLFFQGGRHKGALYVSAFAFERNDTNWPLHLTFIPFLDLCLQNARPEDPTPSNFEPGEIATLSLPAESVVKEVVLSAGGKVLQRATVGEGRAQLKMPGEPGLYELTHDSGAEAVKVFSVNPSPKESRLAALADPAILKTWMLDAPETQRQGDAPRGSLSMSAIWQQQIWWLLLVAGVLALLVETFWTAFRRQTA